MGSRDDALTQDEFQTLLSVAETVQDKIMILMLGRVGLRAGELADIRTRNFRWQRGELECGKKTAAGQRTLPIKEVFPTLWKLCKDWYSVYDTIKRNRHNIRKAVKRLAEKTEIKTNVYPHALRSTAAMYLILSEPEFRSSPVLCDWMGWANYSTAEYYIKKSGIMLKEAFKLRAIRQQTEGYARLGEM